MSEFIKKNIYLIILFIITLSIGFLTFLTFIDKGFFELTDQNLQILLVLKKKQFEKVQAAEMNF